MSEDVDAPRVVVVAIDASPQAEAAFWWYIEHLHKADSCVVVLHSVDLSAVSMPDYEITSEATFTHMWHQQRGKLKALEEAYRWKLNEKGISGKIRTETGKPGEKIVQVAKEENATMIVMGSRGLSKLKRTFQGCVSDYVLHKAGCPVCVCKQFDVEQYLDTPEDST